MLLVNCSQSIVLEEGALSMENVSSLPDALVEAWWDMDDASRRLLEDAPSHLIRLALESAAASIAHWKRHLEPSLMSVQQQPVERGRLDENKVLETAAREAGLFVVPTGRTPGSMDGQIPQQVILPGGRMGLEIKSYCRTVPTEEVDKFRKDLDAGDFVVGVFISMRSPIAKMLKGITVVEESTQRGPVYAVYSCPSGNQADWVRSSLLLAQTLSCLSSRRRAWVPASYAQRLLDVAEVEVAALSSTRKRLREAEEGIRACLVKAGDGVAASQLRLTAAVGTASSSLTDSDFDKIWEDLKNVIDDNDGSFRKTVQVTVARWRKRGASEPPRIVDDKLIIGDYVIDIPQKKEETSARWAVNLPRRFTLQHPNLRIVGGPETAETLAALVE